jgi:predicted RNase H-like nuclease (RuvC/YqgF family)
MQTTCDRLYDEIAKCLSTIAENETYIDSIKTQLENDTLTDAVVNELHLEIDNLEYENDENRRDIAMLKEVLLKEENDVEDTRSSTPYEERYSGWDEVFTGGDY